VTLLPPFIVSIMRRDAEQIRRSANFDRGHMHESGTNQEYECRRDNNNRKDREARVLDFAADHFKAMWC